MKHLHNCEQLAAEREALRAAWLAKYPNACPTCHGTGGTWSQFDPSPAGVSLGAGYLEDFDPCPDCCERRSACPRCGAPQPEEFWSEQGKCLVCGWNWGTEPGNEDALPAPYECYCYEEQEPDYTDKWHRGGCGGLQWAEAEDSPDMLD